MEINAMFVVDLAGAHGRRTLAPTPVRVRGGAVSIDGFTFARDSATGILMV